MYVTATGGGDLTVHTASIFNPLAPAATGGCSDPGNMYVNATGGGDFTVVQLYF
jgi:hypothetical protein